MKRILTILFALSLFSGVKAQYGCFTPSLGIYDANTNAALTATLPCNYANVISIEPTQVYSGNNATSPCMMLEIGTTNANSTTNNSLTMYQGTTQVVSLCSATPAPCWTVIPNSSSYSLSLAFLNPTMSHSYSLCNIATASTFTYKVKSCYSNVILTSGSWLNTTPNNCQGVFVPANSAIGTVSYSINPAVPSTASLSNPTGYLLLDTEQMAAGVYTITYFFDSQNVCTATATRTIQITNPYTGTWTNLTPKCSYNSCVALNPQITGTSGGSFSGTGVSSNSFCPSTAGVGSHAVTYSVGVTQVCGAAVTNTIIVAPTPTANAGSTQSITCANNPTVLAGGGGGTYSWSHSGALGSNFSTVQNPTIGLTGTYSLVVNNGTCISTPATVAVVNNFVQPNLPAIAVSSTINCINTTVTITTSGNTAGATYTWSGPGIVGSANQTSLVVNAGGTYSCIIAHPATGCTSNTTAAVSINTTVPLSVINGAAINCTNNITTLSGNQAGYNYTWTAPGTGAINSGQSTPTVVITGTGVYSVNVMNPANGCTQTYTHLPTTNTTVITPTITTSGPAAISCNVPTINLNGAPGSGVSYTWATSNGNITGGINTQNTSIGAGGIYTLSVTNSTNGCVGTRTISITSNTLAPTAVVVNPNNVILACPAQTAVLTGTATGASTYSWIAPAGGSILNGQGTATAQVTSSSIGVFTLVAVAANGCSAIQEATVSPNTNAPTFTVSNTSPSITCLSASPSVTVNITSTVGISTIAWTPTSGISGPTNTNNVTFTTSGTYSVIITATNGCISTGVVSVGTATTAPNITAGTATALPLSCTNSIVTIDPNYTPSTANLTYTWSGPGIVGSANNNSVSVNQPGTYSLTITNTLTGCSTTSIVSTVSGNNATPNLNLASSSTIGIGCLPSNSTVTLTATSTVAVNYNWSTGSTNSLITTSTPGTYTVVVTDPTTSCSTTGTIQVVDNTTAPGYTATALGNLPCVGTGTLALGAASSNSNISYAWAGTGIISGSNTASPIINSPGIYTVVATDNVTGCSGTATVGVANASVAANFSASATSGQTNTPITFTNNSVGATSYTWSYSNPPTSFTSTSGNLDINFPSSGVYTVTLVSSNGICSDTYTMEITIGGLGLIPELMTPNGDGKNDLFEIKGLDFYPKTKLQVYNRWGNLVYEAAPYKNDWDGTPNKALIGSGKLPVGTYYVILDFGDSEKEIYKGYVQLQY